jgi:hypothetical protein
MSLSTRLNKLSDREKRTIRIAAIGLGAYLVLFIGHKTYSALESERTAYQTLQQESDAVDIRWLKEQKKRARLEALRDHWQLDVDRLALDTVVGDARVAIEKAAKTCRVGLGFARESPGRARAHVLAVFQLSGSGKTDAVAKFFDQISRTGYPVLLDTIHLKTTTKQPGKVTFSFSVSLIDYLNWTAPEGRRA